MKPNFRWIKILISICALAGAAYFFWRASQLGLSAEKMVDTFLAVALGAVGLLAFLFR